MRLQPIIAILVVKLLTGTTTGREPLILGDPPTETAAHKSGLLACADGSIDVYYLREGKNGKEIAVRKTVDEGRTWSPAATVLELPGGHIKSMEEGDWFIVRPLATHDGELHFFLLRCGHMGSRPGLDEFINAWHVRSREKRTRWTEPQLVYEGLVGPPRHALELKSGRIVYPLDHEFGDRDSNYPTGLGEVICAYSDDDGDTWKFSPSKLTVPVDRLSRAPNYGALEPFVTPLRDGRLWMLIRSPVGHLYQSYSSDDGETWSPAEPTRFASSNSPAHVLRLRDGRLLMTWNNGQDPPDVDGCDGYTNRDVLHAAVSADEGRTWCGYRDVLRGPKRNESPPREGTTTGTSYPDAVETAQGNVLVMSGHGPGSAKMVLVDPAWLCATTASTRFDNGLDEWCTYKGVGPIETYLRARVPGASLIASPTDQKQQVLLVYRPKNEPPDGAVWNFPKAPRGKLSMKFLLRSGFAGSSFALADRYYDPTDTAGERQALYDLRISAYRQVMSGGSLEANRWHTLSLNWNVAEKSCEVAIDGKKFPQLSLLNDGDEGPNYLRLRSLAQAADDGFLVESVDVETNRETHDQRKHSE
jgi:hypothetical protein